MSDTEDADLELLRQAALSSLIKKKSSTLQTNALFYRPAANSNLISIQPVQNDFEKDEDSDGGSSSGSEYAVIEEGLSVSSGDVDEVIEEVIVSEDDDSSEEGEGEDAISIASHDSFDEILNSVEEELKGGKKRTASSSHASDGPGKPKRSRRDSESRGKLARDRDHNRPRNDRNYSHSAGRQRRRSPARQKPVPDRVRNRSRSQQAQRRRSFENNGRRSPQNTSRRTTTRAYSRSPIRRNQNKSPTHESKPVKSASPPPNKRDRSRSPTENRKPRSHSKSPVISVNIRKPISPPAVEPRRKSNTGRAYVRPSWMKDDGDKGFESNAKESSKRKLDRPRSHSKTREDRQQANRRGLNNSNKEHKSRSPERRSQAKSRDSDRKSPSPRSKRLLNFGGRRSKSKSPYRKILSFGDTHLRAQEKRPDKTRRSVTTSSGNRSRHKSESPKNGKQSHSRASSKSPEVKSKVVVEKPRKKSKSPPSPRLQNLTEEEREKLEKRRLKFGSSVGKVSGKVVLKNANSPSSDNSSKPKEERRRTTTTSEPEPNPKKSRLGSRLGKVIRDDEEVVLAPNRRAYHEDSVSAEKPRPSRSPQPQREDPVPKDIDKEDLRTKLQQRRAAGRIFSVAMRETLHKESSPGTGSKRGRDRYAGNRNKKSSSRK